MTNEQSTSLIHLVETIADNKFVMGDRLVEVGISGPTLEASLGSIAMAQGELGHARLMYRWASEQQGKRLGKADIKNQTGKAFEQIENASNWLSLIAGLYINNLAIDIVMDELFYSGPEKLQSQFKKMKNEQQDHITFAKDWSHQLLNDEGSIPRVFTGEVKKASTEAENWLRSIENNINLKNSSIISTNSNLTDKFNPIIEELPIYKGVTNVG